MNLKLELNAETIKALLPMLIKAQPYIFGLALVGVFAYTAFALNKDVNVSPAASQTAIEPLPKVVFYQKVIDTLRDRKDVNGDVPINLGTNDPFK
jgi:hypothetical protein